MNKPVTGCKAVYRTVVRQSAVEASYYPLLQPLPLFCGKCTLKMTNSQTLTGAEMPGLQPEQAFWVEGVTVF